MPDIGIVNGGTTGGIIAILIIAVKELSMKWLGRNRGWVSKKEAKDIVMDCVTKEGFITRKDAKEEIKEHEEKERFTALVLDEKTKEVNDKLVKKVDEQDVKVKIFEHQRECQGIIRADMKEHQAQTTTLISQFQSQITTLFSQFQENNRQSIARIHARLDKIADKVGVGG